MKNLKYLFMGLALFVATASHQTHAALIAPYFGDLRSEITNQLTIASNTAPVNKPLIAKLKASLKTIDKNTTNTLAPGVKTLVALVPSLNKTALSNVFDAPLQIVLDIYMTDHLLAYSNLVTELETAYPGAKNVAAQKALAKLLASIDGVRTNMSSTIATKHLSAASKNLIASTKAVANAKKAAAPKSFVNATAPGTSVATFKSKPQTAVGVPFPGNNFAVTAVTTSGSGFNTKSVMLTFELKNLTPGLNSVAIPSGSANLYSIGGLSGATAFQSTGGTSQVTWIPGSRILFGTFNFNAVQIEGSATTTITGSFSVTYPQTP